MARSSGGPDVVTLAAGFVLYHELAARGYVPWIFGGGTPTPWIPISLTGGTGGPGGTTGGTGGTGGTTGGTGGTSGGSGSTINCTYTISGTTYNLSAALCTMYRNNPNIIAQGQQWRQERCANFEDPNDWLAFEVYQVQIGAPDPGGTAPSEWPSSPLFGGWMDTNSCVTGGFPG